MRNCCKIDAAMKLRRSLVITCMFLSAGFAAWPWPSVEAIPVTVATRKAAWGIEPRAVVPGQANPGKGATSGESRQQVLSELKERWRILMAKPSAWERPMEEQGKLVIESVERLLPSRELVELMKAIEVNAAEIGRRGVVSWFEHEVNLLLRSDRAEEAMRALVASDDFAYRNSGHYQIWMEFASKGCTEEQAAWMKEAAGDPLSARILAAGHAWQLSRVDPEAAVKSLFEQFDGKEVTTELGNMLQTFSFGTDTDLEAIEKQIPVSKAETDLASRMRGQLMGVWGARDPAGAANFVLANQERFEPSVMGSVVSSFVAKDRKAATNWIQDIPSGPFLDHAIGEAVSRIADSYPAEARQLVEQVTDPKLRKAFLAEIEATERYTNGER